MDLIKFVLEFVIKNDLVHINVASAWADHANNIRNIRDERVVVKEVQKWMVFLKDKIGATKYYEIREEYYNHCKDDCGFTKINCFEELVEEMVRVDHV